MITNKTSNPAMTAASRSIPQGTTGDYTPAKCSCSDPCFVAFVDDQIVEPCEHLK